MGIPQMHSILFHGALWCFSMTTHWQVTPALICFVAESSGTPLHLGLHGINTAGCLRRWPQNPCWHNFPADGNYALPILMLTNREAATAAGWFKKKNVVMQADMHSAWCARSPLRCCGCTAMKPSSSSSSHPQEYDSTGIFNQWPV